MLNGDRPALMGSAFCLGVASEMARFAAPIFKAWKPYRFGHREEWNCTAVFAGEAALRSEEGFLRLASIQKAGAGIP
ncbi:hypothetical protein [Noviherbaspirillum pedocola]|uniref:Uncharacterized protein n=1 Tax=Noviherbaspirillum pedocola TaxID=2801341 RepID=A0A934SPY5_9BURK|nr:hypothetical protein [Noviherbaspirillum pedocola]MBK4733324.1 hypothetical protein [Noviherbaspirillum pedocola]